MSIKILYLLYEFSINWTEVFLMSDKFDATKYKNDFASSL